MSAPNEKGSWAPKPVISVETAVGSGCFEVDERLHPEGVEAQGDGEAGLATLRCAPEPGFSASDAALRYYADKRIIVHLGDVVLFDGYPVVSRLDWGPTWWIDPEAALTRSGQRGSSPLGFTISLEHVAGRLGRDIRAQIVGRHVRDALILDRLAADPQAESNETTLATGLPCIFNLDGRPNCDPTPIQVNGPGGATGPVHVFADDARDDAVFWTFAKVLRYLLHFYNWPGCPIDSEAVFQQTASVATLDPDQRDGFEEADALAYSLLVAPDALVLEATSLLEALSLIAQASSLHVTVVSQRLGQGVRTSWRVWSDRSGPVRELHLATDARDASGRPLYDASSKQPVDLFAENNVAAGAMRWDARPIAQTALVCGGVKQYEVAVELRPGWLPAPGLDNVDSADRLAAKAAALNEDQVLAMAGTADDDAWHRAYCREGASFADNWSVGRLWILNEDGGYAPDSYARNAPFDDYAPFDFAAVLPGRWMRRRRRFLPIRRWPVGQPGVDLEVSFDAGQSWMTVNAGFAALESRCGIWFDVSNPTSICPSGGAMETNLWYALIDQVFRVRVTAMVDSDERLTAKSSRQTAPSLHRDAAVIYAPDRYRFVCRLGDAPGQPMPDAAPRDATRDDTPTAARIADAVVESRAASDATARVLIPWLDDVYRIGDRVVAVRGRGVSFATQRAPSRRHAAVVGIRYRFGPDCHGTELILGSA